MIILSIDWLIIHSIFFLNEFITLLIYEAFFSARVVHVIHDILIILNVEIGLRWILN
jgi:hypothetical protein